MVCVAISVEVREQAMEGNDKSGRHDTQKTTMPKTIIEFWPTILRETSHKILEWRVHRQNSTIFVKSHSKRMYTSIHNAIKDAEHDENLKDVFF